MSRRGRRRGSEHHEEHPDERWLVSYSDMITVLMILFIMLYAASSVNISKYHAIQKSTAKALGHDPVADTPPVGPKPDPRVTVPPKDPAKTTVTDPADRIVKALRRQVRAAHLAGVVEVSRESRGVVIRFSDRVLFDPGSATLTGQGRGVLTSLSPVLRRQRYPLVIEGHTDNQPIRTSRYPSNWELSTNRSTAVLHQLVTDSIPGRQMSAAGYADTHPRASNATSAGRARNRRVEIVVRAPAATRTATTATTVTTGTSRGRG